MKTRILFLIAASTTLATIVQAGPASRAKAFVEPQADFRARLDATRTLGKDLATEERQELATFLRARSQAEPGLAQEQERFLKNEVMKALIQQAESPADVAETLMAVYRDQQQDVVTRDYAVQHLSRWFESAPTQQQAQIARLFWDATAETDSTIAGTALLALYRMPATAGNGHRTAVGQAAQRLVSDPNAGIATRMTAAQVCGLTGTQSALPALRGLAQTSDSAPLKNACIAAVGELDDSTAGTWLGQMLTDVGQARSYAATRAALKRLQERGQR